MNARLRVVIADDERPARSFLAALLRSFDDVVIVAEAASGKEALTAIERERPDLALLDLQMPELDGIGVVRMLKKREIRSSRSSRPTTIRGAGLQLNAVDSAEAGREDEAARGELGAGA